MTTPDSDSQDSRLSASSTGPDKEVSDYPVAEVERVPIWRSPRLRSAAVWIWVLAAGALLLAIMLVIWSAGGTGTKIVVTFQQGHGIKAGDSLRYRGIDVGRVVTVQLDSDAQQVVVRVELHADADRLAREGSVFWIERPQVSLSGVRGLETVVGAKYLGVVPAPEDAARQTEFQGVESPPLLKQQQPVEIAVRFRNGSGLAAGDSVRYRGIAVGEVTQVELEDSLSSVVVRARLLEQARRLARTGSHFWVERPKVSLTGVRGLETLVGGRYLAVWPGPDSADPQTLFEGLESAPALEEREDAGLEIVLFSSRSAGLHQGAPVTFRGMPVGHVLSVGLSSDAVTIEGRVYIQPAYKSLVRTNSKFWNQSGFDLQIGLRGLQLDAGTLGNLTQGGVAFATPDQLGEPVSTGFRFDFHEKPEDAWLAWNPQISVGVSLLPDGILLPRPYRAVLSWKTKSLGFTRSHQRQGWLLPLQEQGILALPEMLLTPSDALENSSKLELAGQEVPLPRAELAGSLAQTDGDSLVLGEWDEDVLPAVETTARGRLRRPEQVEDCLIVTHSQQDPLPLAAARLQADGEQLWQIDPSIPFTEAERGAAVVAIKDGRVIGLLDVVKGQGRIRILDASQVR